MEKSILTAISSAVLTVALCTGCSADQGVDSGKDDGTRPYIAFDYSETTVTDATRGTVTTGDDITSFGVTASAYPATGTFTTAECGSYFHNLEIDAATGYTGYFWPGSHERLSFFAYTPYGLPYLTIGPATDIGYPRYHYTVPSELTRQVDFMTADVLDQNGEGTEEPVHLTFSHRLTDIRFTCENIGAESITLKSIAINGLRYSGTFEGSSWTLDDGISNDTENPFALTVERSIAPEVTLDVTGTANHFMMLPQTVPAGTRIFDIYATVGGETQHFYHTLPTDLTLEAGKVYTFRLKMSDRLEVDKSTDIMDWNEQTDRTGIPTLTGTDSETQIYPWIEE